MANAFQEFRSGCHLEGSRAWETSFDVRQQPIHLMTEHCPTMLLLCNPLVSKAFASGVTDYVHIRANILKEDLNPKERLEMFLILQNNVKYFAQWAIEFETHLMVHKLISKKQIT